jgi:L-ribulose-5-phosphate 3-epimerase
VSGATPTLAVMQGRLLPPPPGRLQAFPGDDWRAEFERAASAGVGAIEWIYDLEANPLDSDEGVREVRAAAAAHGVGVSSVCADLFMARPLAAGSAAERGEALERLSWLVGRAAAVAASHIVIPFVDDSALAADEDEVAAAQLEAAIPAARAAGVELHLETSLPPERFAALLARVPEVGVTYDSGNSASLGYDAREELAAFGDRVRSVHVKDRVRGGGSVPLGEGDAELDLVFAELRRRGYAGTLVLQVARGVEGREVEWIRSLRDEVERRWEQAA